MNANAKPTINHEQVCYLVTCFDVICSDHPMPIIICLAQLVNLLLIKLKPHLT